MATFAGGHRSDGRTADDDDYVAGSDVDSQAASEELNAGPDALLPAFAPAFFDDEKQLIDPCVALLNRTLLAIFGAYCMRRVLRCAVAVYN